MIFFVVLTVATTAALLALRGRNLRAAARWGLGMAMVVAGVGHLVNPTPFEQHLPSWVPGAGALVAVTGLVEIALGVALAVARSRRHLVGLATAVYLVAVFPANVYVAIAGVDVDGQPGGVYPWLRLPFQALFIAWALWSTDKRSTRVTSDRRPTQPRHGSVRSEPPGEAPVPTRSESPRGADRERPSPAPPSAR